MTVRIQRAEAPLTGCSDRQTLLRQRHAEFAISRQADMETIRKMILEYMGNFDTWKGWVDRQALDQKAQLELLEKQRSP